MSYDRAEFASSKFVNAIGDKKDVQFAGKDLRSFRTSPNNLHGASYDEFISFVDNDVVDLDDKYELVGQFGGKN
jgi:hypothetical protein